MKKTLLSLLGLGLMFSVNAQNPFAYGLSSDCNVVSPSEGVLTVNVSYSLNADAESVNALIKNAEGEVVKTIPLSGITKGVYENVELDLAGIGHGDFTWAIEVKGGATSGSPELINTWKFYHPCGLDVDNSVESPSFGTLFVADGYTDGKTSGYVSAQADGTDGGGLYIIDATGTSVKNTVKGGYRFYGKGLTHTKYFNGKDCGADFSKVAVAEDGRIFVTRYNDLGDYILSAPSLADLIDAGEFTTSLVAGMDMTDTKIYENTDGDFLVGPIQSFDVKGAGENTKLLALTRASNEMSAGTSLNRVIEYNIGTGDVLSIGTANVALDKQYTIAYDKSANIVYDNRGGVWYCQYRGTPSNAEPALVYVDAEGAVKFFEGEGGKSRRRAAISVTPDATRLAASSGPGGVVSIYEIAYAENGNVSLTEQYKITAGGGNMYCATWDVAGNLYMGNASSEYVKCYAIPRTDNVFATKAASKYALTIDEATALGEVNVDANAPVEYYNLQGVKVENPSNGIFIKKQGAKAVKVVL